MMDSIIIYFMEVAELHMFVQRVCVGELTTAQQTGAFGAVNVLFLVKSHFVRIISLLLLLLDVFFFTSLVVWKLGTASDSERNSPALID